MDAETDPVQFLTRRPDERLLGADIDQLPQTVGPPPLPLAESPARRRVVRLGATMTGATLIGGVALGALGVIELIASGSLAWLIALVLGVVLAGTHWGWVHVAELAGNRIVARHDASLEQRRRQWLDELEPYARWAVGTIVGDDGAITITTVCDRPQAAGEHTFTFVREVVAREVHSGEEPAAAVAERAEILRRQAAAQTQGHRKRFEAAREAYERALMAHGDEQQRREAMRAGSEALSERINANLRDPPLIE